MKRRTTGRHRAPLNLTLPITGTATVAASGLLVAALGASTTALPTPPATAFGAMSTDTFPAPEGTPGRIATDEGRTLRSLEAASSTTERPAQAVPAPAPEDGEHSHFGELGFTGITPEPEPEPEPESQPVEVEVTSESTASASEDVGETGSSAAQAREENSTSSRSEARPEAPAEPVAPVAPPATSQGSEAAIGWALANLGLPYSWGSNSGGAYDCSGFTTAAFRAAGISIPHQSEAQYHATSRVSLGEIRRGDLLFYSSNGAPSGIFHVAIYLGDGQVVHSLRDWSGWDGSKVNGINYASGLMAAGRP